ncbi:MAG TPA: hypothetical protein VH054_14805 [Polyangiaceae bacterium]|jgi:hypothetical protein|nr:hypothetical protein [Polyangiaceae bacterium]
MSIRSIGESAPKMPVEAPRAPVEKAPEAKAPGERSPFQRVVDGLGKELSSGERMMKNALSGGSDLGPSDLLALQAGVYRYGEAVDLASKLIDRTSSGVKTIISGGGQ